MRTLRRALISTTLLIAAGCESGGHDGAAPQTQTDAAVPPSPVACDATGASGVEVTDNGLYGYPPYAVDGCALVYVAKGGELRLRDLTNGRETVMDDASQSPRRPAIAGDTIAWEASAAGAASVVRVRAGGETLTLRGAFDHAGEPRVATSSVVFTGWKTSDDKGDTDVFLWTKASGRAEVVFEGPAQQRFADVSDGLVAFTDFSEDPDGRFDEDNNDLADIVVFDRATRTLTTRKLGGKQAFPMIANASQIAYLHWDWAEIHPEPKFVSYWLRSGVVTAPPASDVNIAKVDNYVPPYVRPAVGHDVIEWVDNAAGGSPSALFRSPVDGSRPPSKVSGLDGLELYAPSAAQSFTVLATRAASTIDAPPVLRGVAR